MLKARECYSSDEVYHAQAFKHLSTKYCFGLAPKLGVTVRMAINNDLTKDFGRPNRLYFVSNDLCINIPVNSAIHIHDLAKLARTLGDNKELTIGNWQYFSAGKGARRIRYIGSGSRETIISGDTYTEEGAKIWNGLLDRLEILMAQFMDLCEGGNVAVDNAFTSNGITLIGLCNDTAGINNNFSASLGYTDEGSKPWIRITTPNNKSVMLAETEMIANPDCSDQLGGIANAFLNRIYDIAADFQIGDRRRWVGVYRKVYTLFPDVPRQALMEYVSGISYPNFENEWDDTRYLILTLNSEAMPGAAKATFRYDKAFINDLQNALYDLVKLNLDNQLQK